MINHDKNFENYRNSSQNQNDSNESSRNGQENQDSFSVTPENEKFAQLEKIRKSFNPNIIHKTEFILGRFALGYVSLIAGEGGVGKSLILEKIYADLSKGGEILNGVSFEDKPQHSIVITADFPENLILERNEAFNFGIDYNYVEIVDAMKYAGGNVQIDLISKKGRENIEHFAQKKDLKILFLDSLGALCNIKENDNQKYIEVLIWLQSIARKYNIAIVLVHHKRKRLSNERKNPLELDDIIGGTALTRYCSAVYAIEYDDDAQMRTIRTLKFWFGKHPPKIGYKTYDDIYGKSQLSIILDVEKSITYSTIQNSVDRWELINAFLHGKGTNGATNKDIREYLINIGQDINENTFKSEIKRHLEKGELKALKRGLYVLPKYANEFFTE